MYVPFNKFGTSAKNLTRIVCHSITDRMVTVMTITDVTAMKAATIVPTGVVASSERR